MPAMCPPTRERTVSCRAGRDRTSVAPAPVRAVRAPCRVSQRLVGGSKREKSRASAQQDASMLWMSLLGCTCFVDLATDGRAAF